MQSTTNLATPGLANLNVPKPIPANASMKGLRPTNPFLNATPITTGATTAGFSPTQGGGLGGMLASGTPAGFNNSTPTVTGFSNSTVGIVPTTAPQTVPPTGNIPTSSSNTSSNSENSSQGGSQLNSNQANNDPSSPQYLASINAPNMVNGKFINDSGTGTGANNGTVANNTNNVEIPSNGNSFPGIVNGLVSTASTSSPEYQAAQSQYNTANDNLQQLRTNFANQQGIIANSPIGLSEQGGAQGALATQEGNKEAALTGEMSAAQSAAQVATGQQTTQQSGLNSAGQLTQPTPSQYGQTSFNPGTNTFGTSGSGASASNPNGYPVSPTDSLYPAMQTYANDLSTGQTQNIPSDITGNPALMAQLQQMATAANPNYNANVAAGQGAAQQSNATTAGTASTTANQQIYQQQLSSAANTMQQTQAIQTSAQQLISSMPSLGINPTDSQTANTALNKLATQFSSPQYAQFNANIANLQSKVGALLQAGEIPTSAGAAAQAIVSGSLNLGALQSTLSQVLLEAQQQAVSQASTASTAYQNIQSNAGNSNGSNTNSNTTNYNF
jgi:hypothetical protein